MKIQQETSEPLENDNDLGEEENRNIIKEADNEEAKNNSQKTQEVKQEVLPPEQIESHEIENEVPKTKQVADVIKQETIVSE